MSASFEILPAIDLRGGRVVRLRQGDFSRQTTFSDDPIAVATEFARAGATWLHVVDLDGARAGEPVQTKTIGRMIAAIGESVRWQVGGGLRDEHAVRSALASGATRVVLGTAALADPAFAASTVAVHGADRVAAAIDVRDGLAVGHGWTSGGGVEVDAAIESLRRAGVTTFVVTAIDRDGLLGGPDLALLRRVAAAVPDAVIASGGIASLDDLHAVREAGCAGVIVGRALYEGRFTVAEALASATP